MATKTLFWPLYNCDLSKGQEWSNAGSCLLRCFCFTGTGFPELLTPKPSINPKAGTRHFESRTTLKTLNPKLGTRMLNPSTPESRSTQKAAETPFFGLLSAPDDASERIQWAVI